MLTIYVIITDRVERERGYRGEYRDIRKGGRVGERERECVSERGGGGRGREGEGEGGSE